MIWGEAWVLGLDKGRVMTEQLWDKSLYSTKHSFFFSVHERGIIPMIYKDVAEGWREHAPVNQPLRPL